MNKNELRKELSKELNSLEEGAATDVIIFIKKLLRLNDRNLHSAFWNSKIPIIFIDTLAKSDLWEGLLINYFTSENNCNSIFLSIALSKGTPSQIIRIIKLKRVFNNKAHWISFELLKTHKKTEYKLAYKEFEFIKRNQNYWNDLEKIYFNKLSKYNYEDILIHFTSYFQKFKNYSKKTINNRSLIISYEAILIKLLDKLITELKNQKQLKNEINKSYSIDEFVTKLNNELPPIKPSINVFPKESISIEKGDIRIIIEFYFSKYDNEYQINKYLSGYASFETIEGLEAEITTNNDYSLYRQTLEKGTYEENYLSNLIDINQVISIKEQWDREFKYKELCSLEYFKFYNIPNTINLNNIQIELNKVLCILQTFSTYLFPQGRTFSENGTFKRKIKKEFNDLFTPRYVASFSKNELIENVAEYFQYPLNECEAIIVFLTTDLNSKNKSEINIKEYPFIQVGDNLYWMSSFLKDRKWEVILHRRLWLEKLINHNIISANSEKTIQKHFKSAGFNAISSYQYRTSNSRGEIDTLAFKDGTLFIIELKNTVVIEDMLKTQNYERSTFSQKASNQLNLAKEYILDNFDKITRIEELAINCSIEELNIKTLIVSNSFQADNHIINKSHLKVSLFELKIILNNDLYNVLMNKNAATLIDRNPFDIPLDSINNIGNKNNPNHKKGGNIITKKSTDLWGSNDKCSPENLINAIVQNKVFSHLEGNSIYPIENIELNEYNPSFQYLN